MYRNPLFHALNRKKMVATVLSVLHDMTGEAVLKLKAFTVLLMVSLSLPAGALQVGGIDIPETVQLADSGQTLQLNGAGVRKKFFISIYVGALYLPQAERDARRLLAGPPPNRVLMHFVYSKVGKRKMDETWREGFARGQASGELPALTARLDRFVSMFGDMREGDRVWLDYDPAVGTRVSVNGQVRGVIEGGDFNAALLGVWLGPDPVSESLKKAMVGDDKE